MNMCAILLYLFDIIIMLLFDKYVFYFNLFDFIAMKIFSLSLHLESILITITYVCRYHSTCYRVFTKNLFPAPSAASEVGADSLFELFSKEVIIPRIVEKGEVLSLSHLHSHFKQFVEDKSESTVPQWFKPTHLKQRRSEKFPDISYSFPSGQRNKSQLVYLSSSISLPFPLPSDVDTDTSQSESEQTDY